MRRLALALPGVEEGLSYGTPAFRVKGKFLARLKEDGGSLVVKIDFDEREALKAPGAGTRPGGSSRNPRPLRNTARRDNATRDPNPGDE